MTENITERGKLSHTHSHKGKTKSTTLNYLISDNRPSVSRLEAGDTECPRKEGTA